MRFAPEPSHAHGSAQRTAVLLCNLGTPDAPTTAAVRRYLAEFLTDPRVVELPPLLWRPILHGVVLRVRPRRSAAKYARIWSEAGSPLRVWTAKQATLLGGYLGERGHPVLVKAAMRYGNPSIASQLDALKREGAARIVVLPLYPQYAAAATASAFDAVSAWVRTTRALPELRFVNGYHDHPLYIRALVQRLRAHTQRAGPPDMLVLSFHGVPERAVALGDPYQHECRRTARLVAEQGGLAPERVLVTFQSRFGKAKWIEPHTEPALRRLARQGTARVDVMCPGFTADCLETLEEIAIEGRSAFLEAGGREFHYIECLNDQHEWIAALAQIAIAHMQGWPEAQKARETA